MTEHGIQLLSQVYQVFSEIAAASGKQKEKVLAAHRNNPPICMALDSLLSPFRTYGLTQIKLHKHISASPLRETYLDLFSMLNRLNSVPAVSDALLNTVQRELDSIQDLKLRAFAESLITKSFRLGVTAKTVNKVFGTRFIPIMECMLANKYFEHPDVIRGKEFFLTQKLDGIRCLAFITAGEGMIRKISFYSRQGKLIEGLDEVADDIRFIVKGKGVGNFVFDGELLVDDAYIHYRTSSAEPSADKYKQTIQIVRKNGSKHGVTFNVFDGLHMCDFVEAGRCPIPYSERRASLGNLFDHISSVTPHLRLIPILYRGTDQEEIVHWLAQMRNLCQEGIMINLADAPYECKRTNNLLKVKLMQDCDLRITGFEQGKGRFSGTLGALVLDYKGNPLRVGSGFTYEQRVYFWNNRSDLLGRVVTVQYFEETEDKNGVKSLRFPVFKDLREDGKDVSYT